MFDFARLGRKMLKLGDRRLRHFLELMTSSCADYLGRRFESDAVQAALGLNGMIGTCVGPYSPGSAAVMLHHSIGSSIEGQPGARGYVKGGVGGSAEARRQAGRAFGPASPRQA